MSFFDFDTNTYYVSETIYNKFLEMAKSEGESVLPNLKVYNDIVEMHGPDIEKVEFMLNRPYREWLKKSNKE